MINEYEGVWTQVLGEGPLVAVALHAGHELRPEVREIMKLDEGDRLREEDPFTDEWTTVSPTRFAGLRSRFEVDLNRPRGEAFPRGPEDAWGMDLWKREPSRELIDRSLAQHDAFYAVLKETLLALEREHKRFVIFDLHSYNHRREGPAAPPADAQENPQVNIGTGSMNRAAWEPVVDAFMSSLGSYDFPGGQLDVRENVKFRGRELARFVHTTFPHSGCVIAIEFKKFFMDEWSGKPDRLLLGEIGLALQSTVEPVLDALRNLRKKKTIRASTPSLRRAIRIGLVVNQLETETPGYTTTRLAMTARQMGHEVWTMGVGDLGYDADEKVRARARSVPRQVYKTGEGYLRDLTGRNALQERVSISDLDVLMLRNDPANDAVQRPWAVQAGIQFGRVAMRHGVVVLNDPDGLSRATSKMYFQTFPEEVRPETIITRNRDDIKAFAKDRGTIVLKPLQGSGGQSVFLIRPEDLPNINQMIDSVSRDGFVVAQAYLPAAEQGDTRLFVMNGEALRYKGRYAAFRRVRRGGDLRSNLHAGGTLARAELNSQALELVEIVRPKLVSDGMFLVGLDIVGDKLMEINVFSPGGLGSARKFEGVNFAEAVIKALERKTQAMEYYRRQFDNLGMATL